MPIDVIGRHGMLLNTGGTTSLPPDFHGLGTESSTEPSTARARRTVYRGVFAAPSPISRDTFAVPQPPTQDTYDGCSLVVLYDPPDVLTIFLMAIHDAGCLPSKSFFDASMICVRYSFNHPVSGIDTLSGLLRLSTKYDVEHIRSRMISILTALYPSSLSAFLTHEPPAGYGKFQEMISLP
ncbi:hypothetical protein C8R44DRAFT_880682 [Mycena epipterygia]|nr:hypothetical protein C8R44DRAFT_880682 [Mycena epipterygia]